jgi:hypothetical protein
MTNSQCSAQQDHRQMHVEETFHHLLQQWSEKPTRLRRLHQQVRGTYKEEQGGVAATRATQAESRQHQHQSRASLRQKNSYVPQWLRQWLRVSWHLGHNDDYHQRQETPARNQRWQRLPQQTDYYGYYRGGPIFQVGTLSI